MSWWWCYREDLRWRVAATGPGVSGCSPGGDLWPLHQRGPHLGSLFGLAQGKSACCVPFDSRGQAAGYQHPWLLEDCQLLEDSDYVFPGIISSAVLSTCLMESGAHSRFMALNPTERWRERILFRAQHVPTLFFQSEIVFLHFALKSSLPFYRGDIRGARSSAPLPEVMQRLEMSLWNGCPLPATALSPVAVQAQRKENRAWGCCPEKVGVRSSCRGGRGGLTLDFCWSRDGFWTAVFEKCKYIPCGIFYNSFLPLSSTLFIYLSLCSLRNYLSHMSLIVLKPWALYPAQVFVFILFCFFFPLSSCSA